MEKNTIPELVLEGALEAPEIPELVLGEVQAEEQKIETIARDLESGMTEQEKLAVKQFSEKIDISNSAQMLQYGAAAQKKMVTFSEGALASVRGKDLDAVGEMITSLAIELRQFSPEEEKGKLFGIFKRGANKMDALKIKYDTVEKNVDKICNELERHKITLLKDITMLDKMYEMNLSYYKELTMYIIAGRQRLEEVTKTELDEMQKKAIASGKPEDAQAANDLADRCNRFDKKLHDLELTRNICIQMGPQVRLVQGNDSMMVEKIQSSIVNTIPLWKNQMVLTLGLAHSASAIEAQRKVTDITNELLRKNAETLKISTIEAAKESERGIVDIETLRLTNESLITTLDEVMRIQQEGKQKRREAESELQRIENDLKNKLLEIRDTSRSVQR
jgi:uncharacterized protein YaaN involved in tellurite resistance